LKFQNLENSKNITQVNYDKEKYIKRVCIIDVIKQSKKKKNLSK